MRSSAIGLPERGTDDESTRMNGLVVGIVVHTEIVQQPYESVSSNFDQFEEKIVYMRCNAMPLSGRDVL